MKKITVTINRNDGSVSLDVPKPEEGVWEPSTDRNKPSSKSTLEQRAYYFFWLDGTKERIKEATTGHDGIAVRDTLSWLIRLRILAVAKQTGFIYEFEVCEVKKDNRRKVA